MHGEDTEAHRELGETPLFFSVYLRANSVYLCVPAFGIKLCLKN